MEFLSFRLEKPKFDVDECRQRDLTYSASLKPTLRLVVYDIDVENNTKQVLSAKEQEVYMGEVPMMTNSGTFITNGVQRVVVNQMHRSPGVFFDLDKGKKNAVGKLETYSGKSFGGDGTPLLLSVRSGGKISMPGFLLLTNVTITFSEPGIELFFAYFNAVL